MTHATEVPTSSTSQFFTNHTPADHSKEERDTGTLKIADLIRSFDDEKLNTFFHVEDTVRWIRDRNFKRVALQLPDHFLGRAARIAKEIESQVDAKVFILADTSYRSCCVDEVAAAHASCDAIVHYGDACLSALTENIPVKFVFGSLPVDTTAFGNVCNYLTKDVSVPVLLLTDAYCSEKIDELEAVVRQVIPKEQQFFRADIVDPSHANDPTACDGKVCSLGRLLPQKFCDALAAQVCFVGDPASPLIPLWLMTYPQCTSLVSFNPQTSTIEEHTPQSWRQLRKRLFLVEKLRDAVTVGLVVGSVGVRGHVEAVQRVRELCKAAGKRLYVISVGKVNVPKLSNFADIDVFVLLSCPFGIILDSSDFFRPVLSMFEAEIALNPSKKWFGDGKWCSDFAQFINDSVGTHEDDGADVSLVTGRIRAMNLPDNDKATEGGQVVPYDAGDYFKNSTWRGLDDGIHLDESTKLEEGRLGTALGYDTEPAKRL